MEKVKFESDDSKDLQNRAKHGVSFIEAQKAFLDKNRIIAEDLEHSAYYYEGEQRPLHQLLELVI